MSKEEQKAAIKALSDYQMGVEDATENIVKILEDELSFDDNDLAITRDAIIRSLIAKVKKEQK